MTSSNAPSLSCIHNLNYKKVTCKLCYCCDVVTERSWEMVSTDASDEEDNAAAMSKKPKVETERNLDKASPKKKKQATLTNFFK